MTPEEILEGNKLIAEFMGFIWEEKYNGYYKANPNWTIHGKEKSWIEKIDGRDKLKYHSSWDWLMPVVEKIEKDYHTVLHNKRLTISNADRVFDNIGNTKLEAVYNSVVEFIKWYKEQSK